VSTSVDPKRHVFDSSELPKEWTEARRFSVWRDIYTASYGAADIDIFESTPFSMRTEFVEIDGVGLTFSKGNFRRYTRTKQHVTKEFRDDFIFGFVNGSGRMLLTQGKSEEVVEGGQLAAFTNAEPCDGRADGGPSSWTMLSMSRQELVGRVSNIEDRLVRPFDNERPAVRHLTRYIEFLRSAREIDESVRLIAHTKATLIDLIALACAEQPGRADEAAARGLKAARLREILAQIETDFCDPGFSIAKVAKRQGVTPRYVQDLLYETGRTFTERVLELRLQKARRSLVDIANDRLLISEIAATCGFSEASYFNQCFKRRFGETPTKSRSSK